MLLIIINELYTSGSQRSIIITTAVNEKGNTYKTTCTFNTDGSKTFFINFISTNGNQDYYIQSVSDGTLTEVTRLTMFSGEYIVNYKLDGVTANSVTLYARVVSGQYGGMNSIQVFALD